MRRKEYKAGDRINVYIKRNVSPEMIDWINEQSDITTFFLYAAQQLYEKTGNVDIAEILPRKYDFSLKNGNTPSLLPLNTQSHNQTQTDIFNKDKYERAHKHEQESNESWSGIDDMDDPYA
ncbi:hypothetical protein [Ectobacillus panaciterrae]|uniref:hypothetical protein n=1 Tax=Ectobacillus panaciterrae TaxID=363872 RepID=UPI0003F83364|nr:hypothetical protein [Ectobacillus panaciterrae]